MTLPKILGECECGYRIFSSSVEEKVSMLAQEGESIETADVDDVALDDAKAHGYVCDGEIEWSDEWIDPTSN